MPDLRETSIKVAARFLHSVVLVDDRAFEIVDEQVSIIPLVAPGRAAVAEPRDAAAGTMDAPVPSNSEGDPSTLLSEVPAKAPVAEDLDAKSLVKVFAGFGLVCAVVAPDKNENVLDDTAKAASRADAVVLDWVIHANHGEMACGVIRRLLEFDRQSGGRLRLIVIYTGEPGLSAVIDQVQAVISDVAPGLVKSPSGLSLRVGAAATRSQMPTDLGSGMTSSSCWASSCPSGRNSTTRRGQSSRSASAHLRTPRRSG